MHPRKLVRLLFYVLVFISTVCIIIYILYTKFSTKLNLSRMPFEIEIDNPKRSINCDDVLAPTKVGLAERSTNIGLVHTRPWMTSNVSEEIAQELYLFVINAGKRHLGNQLFNYASLFGIAWTNNRIPLWSAEQTDVEQFFHISIPLDDMNITTCRYRDSNFQTVQETGSGTYTNATKLLPNANISLITYLQSWRYFVDVEEALRHDLTFREEIRRKAEDFLYDSTPWTWKNATYVRVVIHVRHGEYKLKRYRDEGFSAPEDDYFERAMQFYRKLFKRVQFIVLSDDLPWCRRNVVGEHVIYSEGRQPIEDLAIASLCDHAIVTIGSYGWWAAWFANGITVTQANFPAPNSYLTQRFHRKDYYKPQWVAM